jgi:hypothetical protein
VGNFLWAPISVRNHVVVPPVVAQAVIALDNSFYSIINGLVLSGIAIGTYSWAYEHPLYLPLPALVSRPSDTRGLDMIVVPGACLGLSQGRC